MLCGYINAEPKITVYGFPDKVSDQILNCSDVLKYGRTLIQCIHFHLINDKNN